MDQQREKELREAVVKEALSWVGTPFVWEACVKGVGVDCGRFLAGVFNNVGVTNIELNALPHLPWQWFLHEKGEDLYLNIMKMYGEEYQLAPGQIPRPGDIVVAKQGRGWAHAAIVISWPRIVGAAYEHVVCLWPDINTSPQYMKRALKYINPFLNK